MEIKKLVTELKNKLSRTSVLASYVIFTLSMLANGLTHHL